MFKQKTVLSFFQKQQPRENVSSCPNIESNKSVDTSCNLANEKAASANLSSEIFIGDPANGVKSANIIDGPYQPSGNFKVHKVLGKSRSFSKSWYSEFPWLEYSMMKDAAFCFCCRLFAQSKTGRGEDNFVRIGVSNWKKAIEKFKKHECSERHLKSMQFWGERKSCGNTIVDKLSESHSKQVQENRVYLKFIAENILFLGKQCLALRGHDESSTSFNKGNFLELLNIRAKDKGKEIEELMKSRVHSYTSAEIQNEFIKIIQTVILKNIVNEINSCSAFSIICDETTDIASKEQLSICARYVSNDSDQVVIKERFLGFIDVISTKGSNLHKVIKDFLLQIGLEIDKLRGQAYDGAANMSGKFKGVAAKFKEEDPRVIFTHCHAHLLDLAVMRFCQNIKSLRNALNIVNSLHNLVTVSAKRFAVFESICNGKDTKAKKLCRLSKTRWTVRHRALAAIIDQFPEIIETLEVISNDSSNLKIASEADGIRKLMSNFEFIFSIKLLYRILSLTDILSKELQNKSLDIMSLFPKIEAVIKRFESERNEEYFTRIWRESIKLSE